MLSNYNVVVRFRLVDTGQEVTMKRPYYPQQPGAECKVRVMSVRPDGQVGRVEPA